MREKCIQEWRRHFPGDGVPIWFSNFVEEEISLALERVVPEEKKPTDCGCDGWCGSCQQNSRFNDCRSEVFAKVALIKKEMGV